MSQKNPLTMDDTELDTLIESAHAEADEHRQRFIESVDRAELLSLLRLTRQAPSGATHVSMDWSGEAWFAHTWTDPSGAVVAKVDEDLLDLGPTPSSTKGWDGLIDTAMPNTSCLKHVEISAVLGAIEPLIERGPTTGKASS